MIPLWTAADAARATGGEAVGDWAATGVSIDTRTLRPGDLFVALAAARDGHDFVAQALAKGAAAALVSHRPEGVAGDAPLLIVPDVLRGLEALGVAARARTAARVIAVTGSVGKTSTKEMLRAALDPQGRTHAAEASYNNHWGVPLTLARMPADTEYAVIEVGMSNPGEIAPLAKLARPHVAMVTTVAAAHLESFGSLAGIAAEKATIMDGLEPGGVAVLNADLPTSGVLLDHAAAGGHRVVTFGAQGDWALGDVRITDSATVIAARHDGTDYLFKLAVPGRHFALNALAVLAGCEALGADPVQAAQDICQWSPPQGRGTREVIVLDQGIAEETLDLIDDAFNANPTSMAASLEVLAASHPRDGIGRVVKGRRIAILGDMLELGADEMQMHADLAENLHLARAHVVHCAGPRMRALFDALPGDLRGQWAPEADDLAGQVAKLVDAGDVVLVKGSKGSKISRVVDAIRKLGHRS
ncbi:UDP-N-acetylmuramoyl-tripeptide--D-alanyl-D-alanine ligase [Loktanella sp. M215]|uniref:UDP-N-acetylmuramoyl-tripeptide--D-alanyl-D- alanine ligase n=1 Tax=Loktanella sp. M215 TaxID=2675431 RepID=UPI001F007F39|nr:UDP-N-acetylmuramoyl-tripeptide--D-alanyl-D-alanine ligase [Loktanella sp. M215]MCF7699756.1 UDP-N-acetylmuramoyl-tripeptide--D-alanyl-D-alanine ligase [Loktanella sp. M215]